MRKLITLHLTNGDKAETATLERRYRMKELWWTENQLSPVWLCADMVHGMHEPDIVNEWTGRDKVLLLLYRPST